MTVAEKWQKVAEIYDRIEDDYDYIGIRYEDKLRQIGDICECSKDNPDRADERDFPEYGTEEYENLPDMPGTSTWGLNHYVLTSKTGCCNYADWAADWDCEKYYPSAHCYIVVGNHAVSGLDEGEICINDAVVLEVMY
jgi:hypothetical protein